MNKKHRTQPLFLVVAALGVLFTVTACAYGVMAFRDLRGGDAYSAAADDADLMALMRERGAMILAVEVAALAAASVAAMAADRHDNAAERTSVATEDQSSEDQSNEDAPSTHGGQAK